MVELFRQYAKYYDVINQGKPYDKEAAYITTRLRGILPGFSQVLELGSGTGRHGHLLSANGVHVHGIELSREMAEVAQESKAPGPGSFECEVGDIRSVRLARQFDAVMALFHVMSYQVRDCDFAAVLKTAAYHLPPGGVFVFDAWHGPAVLSQTPEIRVKTAVDSHIKVVRTATPDLRVEDKVVIVNFDFACEDSATDERVTFSEQHPMRFLFQEEVAEAISGIFNCLAVEELVTSASPSVDTWAVAYFLQKT